MRDYREKDVKGMLVQNNRIYPVPVTVRMTSDKVGQTMSFTAGNTQISIALEDVKDIVKVTELKP